MTGIAMVLLIPTLAGDARRRYGVLAENPPPAWSAGWGPLSLEGTPESPSHRVERPDGRAKSDEGRPDDPSAGPPAHFAEHLSPRGEFRGDTEIEERQ